MKDKKIMILLLALLLTMTVTSTFAYWQPSIDGDVETVFLNIKFGQWEFTEIKTNDGYVDFFKDIKLMNDEHPYKTLIKGLPADSYDVIVVYYPPTGIFYKLDIKNNKSVCYPYNSNTGCMLPDISDPYNNPYEHIQLEFMDNIEYPIGSETLYEGNYYYKYDGNQGRPESLHYDHWIKVKDTYDSNRKYQRDDRIIIDGQLFKAKRNGFLSHPHQYNGDWNLFTFDYVASNTYKKHDVVLYEGKYYYATMDDIMNISPDNSTYWKLAG